MGRLLHSVEAPYCPVCEGPCREDFDRSPYSIPDRLPRAKDGSADPIPEKAKKPNRRGRRPESHAPKGPEQDRMVRPSEDR